MSEKVSGLPPRGLPLYRFYCPRCDRHGVQGWQWEFKPEERGPVDPATFRCPDCLGPIEIEGREDQ